MPVAETGAPRLASLIVRSMARPELTDALASLAEQTYPCMEIVLVDATGDSHPALARLRQLGAGVRG